MMVTHRATRAFRLALASTLLSAIVHAAQDVKVEVRVRLITGTSYYLDLGRASGLAEGDRVTFFPVGSTSVTGTVRSVAKSSARVELDASSVTLVVGVRGEILIPAERVKPVEPKPDQANPPGANPTPQGPTPPIVPPIQKPATTPEHPPWAHPPESWSQDKPLLAPAFAITPEERERRVTSRVYFQSDVTVDTEGETSRFFLGGAGVDTRIDNPFGQGGSLRFDAQAYTLTSSIDGADDDSSARVNRFTYEFGGTMDRPDHWQFGRFVQHEFSALGLLDGVEWSQRASGGSVLGASFGAMPERYPPLESFDDWQAAVFYRHSFDAKRRNTLGVAYQNTWHGSQQDRNLFVVDAEARPVEDLTLRTSAWIDHYDASDTLKGAGFELTELQFDANWRTTKTSGLGFFYASIRWPELLRDDLTNLSPNQVQNGELERTGLSGWVSASESVRLSARVDTWKDESDSGTTGEVGSTLSDLLYEEGEVSMAILYADGAYSSGPGARLSFGKDFGTVFGLLGYDYVSFEQKDFSGDQQTLAHHSVFGSFDIQLGESWDLSLRGDNRFGDEVGGYSIGFLLQSRF